MEETREQPRKSEVIGSFIGMGMVGFCFGIGLMLAVKTVDNLECCISRNAYKMAEENQLMKELQQQQVVKELKEPQ